MTRTVSEFRVPISIGIGKDDGIPGRQCRQYNVVCLRRCLDVKRGLVEGPMKLNGNRMIGVCDFEIVGASKSESSEGKNVSVMKQNKRSVSSERNTSGRW